MRVTLYKAWKHPNGRTFPKGAVLKCTQELAADLEVRGYLSDEVPEKPKAPARKRTTKKNSE